MSLVERMQKLHEQLAGAKASQVQATIQTRIDATDREIDQLVYALYGLTADEIRIVEGATGAAPTVPTASAEPEDD